MPKPVRAASRFALGALAALALVFGGLTAPAFADDAPVEPPVSESTETPTAPVEEVVAEEADASAEEQPAEDEAVDGVEESVEGDEAEELVDPADLGGETEEGPSAPQAFQALSFDSLMSLSSSVSAGNVDLGTASWGLSTYLATTAAMGSINTLPSGYVSPASFDSATSTASWGDGFGTVESDGSATIGFAGASLNYAATGNRWLKLADLEATLDANGNGTVTALVSYGPGVGSYPASSYDPTVAAYRGPSRVNVLTLTGNTAAQFEVDGDTATWTALAGQWHADLDAFLAGDSGASIPALSYRSQINNTGAANQPKPITFQLGIRPPAASTVTTLVASPSVAVATGTAVTLSATVSPAAAGTVTFREGSTVLGSPVVVDGAGVASLAIGAPGTGSHGYTATFAPSDSLAFLGSTGSVAVTVTAPPTPAPGSLAWAIKSAFNDYIVNGAAHGSISVSGGASGSGSFTFPQASSASWSASSQTGTVSFAGSVHYYGHSGLLDVTFSNPAIVVHSSSSATLHMNGTAFATLNLGAASKSVGVGGDVTWSGVPATLTAGGAASFAGFYNAGDALDPLTFTAGAAASGVGGGMVVVASAQTAPQRTPAATPPATTGVSVVGAVPAQGGTVTIEASGFQPNEAGILIVIYSEPVLLGTVTADAAGVARWTGKLPSSLSGVHTLTMQGSVSHGTVVSIKSAAAAAGACTIEDATLTWGFKESFRSYITSSIANGEWTLADGASYETPEFAWSGSGSLDPESETGEIAFSGSVRFTGHDGALDTTIANPRVVLSADGAVLLLDVTGTTQDGSTVDAQGVEFATLDLGAATPEESDGTLTWSAIPAVLTEDGSIAFGTYEAGEALDALTLSVALPADCGAVVEEGATPAPEVTTAVDEEHAGLDLTWLWWLIGALVVVAIIVAVVVTAVRRRSAR